MAPDLEVSNADATLVEGPKRAFTANLVSTYTAIDAVARVVHTVAVIATVGRR